MNIKTRNFSIFLIVFLILTASVFALKEDFNAFSQKKVVSACSDSVTTNSFVIKNTGEVTSVYSITNTGFVAPYATFTESEFSLEPGETKTVDSYIKAPNVEGSYDLKTEIKTLFGLEKTIEQNVQIEKCVNLQLYVKENEKTSCPCDPVTYELELKNTGASPETYRFSLSDYSEYASFSENPVILGAGESRDVFIFLNMPCGIYGEKEIELTATAEKSQYYGIASLKLNIDRECYAYSIKAESKAMCNFEKAVSLITLNNTADVSNTYTLDVDGAGFAGFENDMYLLHPESAGTAPLKINTENVPAGKYNFTINSVSERGKIKNSADMSVDVQNCYSLELSAAQVSDNLINCEERNYEIIVKNPGINSNSYNLQLDGSNIFSISKNALTIGPGAQSPVSLNVKVPCNETGKSRYALLTASLLNNTITKKLGFAFNIHSVAEGYMIEYEVPKKTIDYETNNVSVILRNSGLRKGNYVLSISGPAWARLSEKKATLDVGEGKEILILTNPSNETPEGKYGISVIAQLENSDVAYKSAFNLNLIRIPLSTKILNAVKHFLDLYWLFVLLGIIILVALILIGSTIRKITKVMKERPKQAVQEAEESYRLRINKAPAKGKLWKILLAIFFILLIAGAALLIYSNLPLFAGILGQKNITEEPAKVRMFVDKNELTVIGKTLFIGDNATLRVIVKNYEDKNATYKIKVNVPWIELSTKKIELGPNESKIFFIRLTPPESGIHKVTITLENEDNSYAEKLDLKIINKSYFTKYWGYLAAGLVLLIILLLTLRRRQSFKVKEERVDFKIIKERKRFKKICFGIIILLVIASAGYLTYDNLKKPAPGAIDFGEVGNESFRIDINKNQKISLPLMFKNKFENDVVYKIDTDVDWIDASSNKIRLSSNESEMVEVLLTPGKDVEDGIYKLEVSAEVEDQNIKYTKTLELYVKTNSLLKAFLYWLLGILLVILAITGLSKLRKNYNEKRMIAEDIRREVEFKKKSSKRRKRISLK